MAPLGGSLLRAPIAALFLFTQAARADIVQVCEVSTLVTHKYGHTTIIHYHDEVVVGPSTATGWVVYTRPTYLSPTDLATATLATSQPIETSKNPAPAPPPPNWTTSPSLSSQATQEPPIPSPVDVSFTTESTSTSQAAGVPDDCLCLTTSSTSQDVSTQTTGGVPLSGTPAVSNGSPTAEETSPRGTFTRQPPAAPSSSYRASQSSQVSTPQQPLPTSEESTEGLVATMSSPPEDFSNSSTLSEQLGSLTSSSASIVSASTGPLDSASSSTSEQDESQTSFFSSVLSTPATAPNSTSSAAVSSASHPSTSAAVPSSISNSAESTGSQMPSSSSNVSTSTGALGSATTATSEQAGSQASSSSFAPLTSVAAPNSTSSSPRTTESLKSSSSPALSTDEVESPKSSSSSESSTPTALPSPVSGTTDGADLAESQKPSSSSESSTPTASSGLVPGTTDGADLAESQTPSPRFESSTQTTSTGPSPDPTSGSDEADDGGDNDDDDDDNGDNADEVDEAEKTENQKPSPEPASSTSTTPTESAAEVIATGDSSEGDGEDTIVEDDDDDDDDVVVIPVPLPDSDKDKPKDKPKKGKKKEGEKEKKKKKKAKKKGKAKSKGGWWWPFKGTDNPFPNPGLADPHKPTDRKPDKKPDKKPDNKQRPDPDPSPEQSLTLPTETPTVTATDDAPECTEPVAFEASCWQECTTFSYNRPNATFTSTWSECGDEECSTAMACEPTPAVTVTSWSTSTCSKTITQTDVCEQLCTKIISKQTSTRGYTTETKCPSSVSCSPTVVCDPVEPTTTTSYTTKIPKPTQACFLHRNEVASRVAKLENSTEDDGVARSNDTVATLTRKRAPDDGIHIIRWNSLTHPNTWSGGPKDWYERWQTGLYRFGAGAMLLARNQFMEDDFAPSHAVYHPFGDMPFGTGVKNMDGCVAMLVVSPHGVYVGHFYEMPTFEQPIPEYFSMPLMYNYEDTERTWEQRVTDFILHGNLRFMLDGQGQMVPNQHDPASPSLVDLASDPSKPFHNMREMEWSRVHFFAPVSPANIAASGTGTDYSHRLMRMRDLVKEVVSFGGHREYSEARMKFSSYFRHYDWETPVDAESQRLHYESNSHRNMLMVQYAPFNLDSHGGTSVTSPYRSVRVWFDGKIVFQRHWCIPNLAELLPIPPNLPDNTNAGGFAVAPPPTQSGPGLRLAARQDEGDADIPEVEAPTCPLTPSRVCAVDVGQTVLPSMNPSIQGTIDVTDDEGRRAHLEDFSGVPFGGFVTSEAVDNRLGFNVTMQFDGSWDKFLIDEGYACNCTDSGCDLYSAQCCLKGDCPECDCPGGVCKVGSPLCCADNSCNATRPREPTNYPFKAWDVKVFIKGEKGIGEEEDEDRWAKNVTCTSSKWDYLNETVIDGSCLAHRHLRCLWDCSR